jgi:hypothetical protein
MLLRWILALFSLSRAHTHRPIHKNLAVHTRAPQLLLLLFYSEDHSRSNKINYCAHAREQSRSLLNNETPAHKHAICSDTHFRAPDHHKHFSIYQQNVMNLNLISEQQYFVIYFWYEATVFFSLLLMLKTTIFKLPLVFYCSRLCFFNQ